MRLLPESLASEFRRGRGPWSLYGARFTRSFPRDSEHRFGAWITVLGSSCSAEVELTATSAAEARRVRAALKRSGYHVGAIVRRNWLFGRRVLRGLRELEAEVPRLEALVRAPEAVESLPARAVRPPTFRKGPFADTALDYLEALPGWVWSWTGVERAGVPALLRNAPGWRLVAWCSLLRDPDGSDLDLGVQVHRPNHKAVIDARELRRIKAAFLRVLGPEGYELLGQRSRRGGQSGFLLLNRSCRGLAEARRGRARLDELLFDC